MEHLLEWIKRLHLRLMMGKIQDQSEQAIRGDRNGNTFIVTEGPVYREEKN